MEEESGKVLTKRERRELAKEQKSQERTSLEFTSKIKKFGIWILVIGALGGGGYWLYREATKPLPGEEVEDMGQGHVSDISSVNYNSNPPTSGSHFAVWAKRGVYDRVISDGYLIHSLEHGYIVVSYNCSRPITNHQSLITSAYAHETGEPHEESQPEVDVTESGGVKPLTRMKIKSTKQMSWFTPDDPPDDEIGLPNEFGSDECKKLVEDLRAFLKEAERVIIVPRVNLDTRIALTAWGRIDKLDDFDSGRIKNFIKAFHNRGPEQTRE